MKSLNEDIAFWRTAADHAPTKAAALVAFGIGAGLQMARAQLDTAVNESAENLAKWLASSLASGWEGEPYKIIDMRRWTDDVRQALDLILKKQ